MNNKNRAITYSLLTHIRNNGNIAKGPFDIFIPLLKKTISVNFSVGNTSTMQSASRPPVIGYLPGWKNTVGRRINESFQTGWGQKHLNHLVGQKLYK